MINVESQYTKQFDYTVDPMMFFQDNSLDKADIINTYENLIAQGKFDEATEYISQQENIYRYSADYFNAIEDRIYALQEYLIGKDKKNMFVHSNTEPTQVSENTIWID